MQRQFPDKIGDLTIGPYAFSSGRDSEGNPYGIETKFYVTAITT